MRIAIDLQGAQSSGSKNRGIGRYTLWLVKAILEINKEDDIHIVLNGGFEESAKHILNEFSELIPRNNIHVWWPPGSVSFIDTSNSWKRKAAELIREQFVNNLNPDFIILTSLFEGGGDDAVTSIGLLEGKARVACILYDLIPYIYKDIYLSSPLASMWYESKLSHMRRADLLLAISDSSCQEGIDYLGFDESNCISISTATDKIFKPEIIDDMQKKAIFAKYGFSGNYIMYTGGIDHRKNIDGLIRAYSLLSNETRSEYQLAIVCSIRSDDIVRFKNLARKHNLSEDRIVFTDFVPESDLVAIYNMCSLFVFPSWHEGFGLPALEAMSCGKAVIGSNKSSVPEVIGRSDALFDPYSDNDIANKMSEVLNNPDFRAELEAHGLVQSRKFSWMSSAKRALDAIHNFHERNKAEALESRKPSRPKLAYISPLPPERSGISDYSAELLPELAVHYEIDVIIGQQSLESNWIKENCTQRSIDWFRRNSHKYDRVLYHFGNSPFHQHMFDLIADIPGVVVLHDFFLSGVVAYMEMLGIKPGMWKRELLTTYGYNALQQVIDSEDKTPVVSKYPCNRHVLENAFGVIVHSETSKNLANHWYGKEEQESWFSIPLLRKPAIMPDKAAARARLNIPADKIVVCSFGLLGPTKLNNKLLEAWMESSLVDRADAVLVFVGENHTSDFGNSLNKVIHNHRKHSTIRITGWVDENVYKDYLSAADIAVQLRTNSRGETSAAVLDCMNYGLPTIANINGSMADLPDDAVLKIPDDFSIDELVSAMELLASNADKRLVLGSQARSVIHKFHSPRQCAAAYMQAIERIYAQNSTTVDYLLKKISEIHPGASSDEQVKNVARSVTRAAGSKYKPSQILVDVSALIDNLASFGGIALSQVLREWLTNPPGDFLVEPVYYSRENGGLLYAREYTFSLLGITCSEFNDEKADFCKNDILVFIKNKKNAVNENEHLLDHLKLSGVMVNYLLTDDFDTESFSTLEAADKLITTVTYGKNLESRFGNLPEIAMIESERPNNMAELIAKNLIETIKAK